MKLADRLIVVLAVVIATMTGCKEKAPPPSPPEVQFITATPTNIAVFQEWIGTLDGLINAHIRAQVTGTLQSQEYTEGSQVRQGDRLFQIDPRPFQAALDQAKAKLAQDEAQAKKTQMDVERYTPLAKEQAISQEELDNAIQANAGAKSQLEADGAAITNAQLNLDFAAITSPIDGLAGIATAQIGDLVGPSTAVLTTVSQIDPIKVYFQVNEQSYLTFWRKFLADTNEQANLELILSDNSVYPERGKFFAADRQVNPTTGTMQIAGVFPNPQNMLRPGQYGRVRAQTHNQTNVFILPARAVAELQGGYQVVVADAENKARIRPVKIGEQLAAGWIIESGLQSGDRVVIEGTQAAREDTLVAPKPYTGSTNVALASTSQTNQGK